MIRSVVTGAGGFIGHHLVNALKDSGRWVRGADLKYPEYGTTAADDFWLVDLRDQNNAHWVSAGVDEVWSLAANMGGMGYISCNDAQILRDNLQITLNTLEGAARNRVHKIIYTSSACVYPNYLQGTPAGTGLAEHMVMPADPQHGYGWEKLTGEKLHQAYGHAGWISVRIARLHNIYGPLGTWRGGREKAPAALCRKAAEAPDGGHIDVWGDGQQTRSFCYIGDAVEGLLRLADTAFPAPVNIGSAELVTVDELAQLAIARSGKDLTIRHVEGPQGVRGRNSDNIRCRSLFGWEPATPLRDGIAATYDWVASQVREASRAA